MNLSPIINLPLSQLALLSGLLLLAWALLLWFLKGTLPKNGKIHLEVNGKEVVEVGTESSSQNKSTSNDTQEATQSEEKPEENIKVVELPVLKEE